MTRWLRIAAIGLLLSLNGLPILAALRHERCARLQHACASETVLSDDCCCVTIRNVPAQITPLALSFTGSTAAAAETPVVHDPIDQYRVVAAATSAVVPAPWSTRNLPLRI